MARTQDFGFEVRLDDERLDSQVHNVLQVRVEQTPNAPASASVVVADLRYELTRTVKLGTSMKVLMAGESGGLSLQFAGEIVELSIDENGDSAPELRVDALDRSHRLALGTTVHSYTNRSVMEVLRTLTADIGSLEAPGSIDEEIAYLLQAASPMALLTELVERAGCTWRCDSTGSRPKVIVAKPAPRSDAISLRMGEDLFRLSARHNGRSLSQATVRGWDVAASTEIDETARGAAAGTGPFSSNVGWTNDASVLVTGTPVLTRDEAKNVASAVVDRSVARAVTVRGVARFRRDLVPGAWIEVEGGAGGDMSYLIDRVVHSYDTSSGSLTTFEGGDAPLKRVAEVAAGGTNPGSSLRLDALVIGIVSDNNDDDDLGRVKVKFPWLSVEHGSHWARVVTVGGGGNGSATGARGIHFMPEIGDEVLVGFENGDLRRPVVLGSLYSDQTKVPAWELASGSVKSRSITTRKGHKITFSDGDGADAHVEVMLSDGKTFLRLTEDNVDLEVPSGNPAAVKVGNANLTFDKQGNITLKGQKITLDGTELEIKGTQKVALTAPAGSVTVESGGSIKVSGINTEVAGTATLKASGGQVSIN